MAFEKNFENEFIQFLDKQGLGYTNNCSSMNLPDFSVANSLTHSDDLIELKEKVNPYSPANWGIPAELERNLAIIDELTIRKGFLFGPKTFVCVRDYYSGKYYANSVLSIMLGKRMKRNRNIGSKLKGKWVVDLRDWHSFGSIPEMYDWIVNFSVEIPGICSKFLPCFGEEEVEYGGVVRTEQHRDLDKGALSQ